MSNYKEAISELFNLTSFPYNPVNCVHNLLGNKEINVLVMRVQACLNISEAFPVRKLGIGQTQEQVITGKPSDLVIALVLFNEFVKLIPWQILQYLSEDRSPGIHRQPHLPLLGRKYRPENAM